MPIQFLILFALLFYIVSDHVLAPMFSNRASKIPISPEFASPQFLLYLGATSEYFSSSKAFYNRYNLRHTIHRNRLHQKMDMILIRTNFQKLNLIPFLYIQTNFFQNFIHVVIKYSASIFCWKNQMVKQHRNIMALVYVFAHTHVLRRKRRGIQPQGIETWKKLK